MVWLTFNSALTCVYLDDGLWSVPAYWLFLPKLLQHFGSPCCGCFPVVNGHGVSSIIFDVVSVFSIHYPSFYCFDKDIFVLNKEYSNLNINYKDNPINKKYQLTVLTRALFRWWTPTAFLHIFQYVRTACECVNSIVQLANKWLLRASSFQWIKNT